MRKWEDPSRHQKLVAGAALDTPLYKEVKRLLTETISAGEWKPGSAIPAEWKLAERFRISNRCQLAGAEYGVRRADQE